MKKIYWAGSIVLIFLIIVVVAQKRNQPKNQSISGQAAGKIKVAASFFPLADFTKNVGGQYVEVVNITPAGAEPHDYEPTPRDIAAVYSSKLFVLNGNGVDAWGEKIRSDLESQGVTVVRMADHMNSLKNNSPDQPNLPYDPHFWLDPVNAAKEVDLIAEGLIKIDPGHQAQYQQNRDAYKARLADLDRQFKTGLAMCQQHTIATSHNAFNYMANQYGLSTIYILGLSPDAEPTPQDLANVAKVARQKNIKYIFFESLVSPKLAQTVASEIGAKTLELNPIEGFTDQEISNGKNYISVMKMNLSNLRIALECK